MEIFRKAIKNKELSNQFDKSFLAYISPSARFKDVSYKELVLRVVIGLKLFRKLIGEEVCSLSNYAILQLPSKVFKYYSICYAPEASEEVCVLSEIAYKPNKITCCCELNIKEIKNYDN